ncbi:MAG: DUF359 domain-containing protein [Candidatus Aenigmarchaeota archaeon]|nr:DUF359 domain-containing protein [Candidatus Aenigmarchaeota archaeon]NIP40300.1 DUF359 domain-containing protein [Candidatus Aenigmarchaeota archaeon]NIQ17792.1 DUF359 domain-containing protein [Candidatus Aenigmarchaeota archaeon]NIS73175.1 DUF359 domain-containing protein [Candidatus Aenigmarchaeota archaeon]
MIIAITGTPATGKTEVAKALAKRMGWWYLSLNDLAEEEDLYKGYDEERMCKIVDLDRIREEVHILGISHKNMVLDGHYSHEMPCDVVIVLRTGLKELRKRMGEKGWLAGKIKENLSAEAMDICRQEALELNKNTYEFDTTRKKPHQVAKEIENVIKGETFIFRDLKVPETEDVRIELRRVYGTLMKGEWKEITDRVKKETKGKKDLLITVGDVTSYHFIENRLLPDLIIIDGVERRKKFGKRIVFKHPEVKVKNPPGHITVDLWRSVEESFKKLGKGKRKILVEGEEDLAVIPCVMHAPLGTNIFYGHFEHGLVWMKVDEKIKRQIKGLIETIVFLQ